MRSCVFQNIEVYGADHLVPLEGGGFTWSRVSQAVEDGRETGVSGLRMMRCSTGVELRFVMLGDEVKIRMGRLPGAPDATTVFHVFHGGLQGGYADHETDRFIPEGVKEFTFRRLEINEKIQKMSDSLGSGFAPTVVRVIFDRGLIGLYGVEGDVRPPLPSEVPGKTVLFHGSSITHGSNALSASETFPSKLGRIFNVDVLNLGLAGCCYLEQSTADYLSEMGRQGLYSLGVLELGININTYPEDRIYSLSRAFISTVVGPNPDIPYLVVSPPFFKNDMEDGERGERGPRWRRILKEVCSEFAYPNLTYVNGLDLLGAPKYLSCDEIHPSIDGIAQITAGLEKIIREKGLL